MDWRDERVSGGKRKIGWPKRPVADRGRFHGLFGSNARLVPPSLIVTPYVRAIKSKTQNVRDTIQQGCGNRKVPSQGWSHQAVGGRSTLRAHTPPFFFGLTNPYLATPQPAVLQLLQARCVLQGAIAGHLGPHFPGPFESSHCRRRQYRETRNVGLYG